MEPTKNDAITTSRNLRDYRKVIFFESFKGSGS